MAIRAHRGTSRAFWKPIRTPECRPDRQKVGKRALATAPDLPRTAMHAGPGRVDAIAAHADAATNALESPAEHTEGWHRHSKAPPAPQASPGFPRINS